MYVSADASMAKFLLASRRDSSSYADSTHSSDSKRDVDTKSESNSAFDSPRFKNTSHDIN